MAKTRLNHIIRFFKNYLYPTRILRRFAPQLASLTEFHPILLGNAIATLRHQRQLKSAPIFAVPEGALFTTNWFGDAMWVHYFASIKAEVKNYLEVGSFEGRSALFAASLFPKCRLTCVDTFAGGSEHNEGQISGLEARFLKNIEPIKSRVRVLKGASQAQLAAIAESEESAFDFILIDGSHYYRHVLVDTLISWPMLKVGGIMVWDDYLWCHSPYKGRNPKAAIDQFLQIYRADYEIIFASTRVAIRKTAAEDRYLR
jgi:predicted O-methyltransferase YrrM